VLLVSPCFLSGAVEGERETAQEREGVSLASPLPPEDLVSSIAAIGGEIEVDAVRSENRHSFGDDTRVHSVREGHESRPALPEPEK
jgi:hypothetical protein